MLNESNLSTTFSRPTSIAIIDKNYLFCKCEQDDNGLYRFHIDDGGQLALLDKLYAGESLLFIKSGTDNFFFGVGSCGRTIYFYDIDLNLLGSYAFSLGSKVTAINYDKNLLRFYVAISVGDSLSNINVCTLNSELSVCIEEVYQISTGNVSGLNYIGCFNFVISDNATSEVYIYNSSSGQRKVCAKFGRDGKGFVRAPGPLLYLEDRFAVVDRDNYIIQFYNFQGEFIEQIGGKGISTDSLDLPMDIVTHGDLMIVADMNNDRLISYKYIDQSWVGRIEFVRNFCPGKLSRPISFRNIFNHLYIADRSNDRVQVLDENLDYVIHFPRHKDFLFKQPTSVCCIEIASKCYLAVLSRNANSAPPAITIIDAKTGYQFLHKNLPELYDPQGMVECGLGRICVMDTLNRRAMLYDGDINLLSESNLAKLSQLDHFLCRVPSVIDGDLYFCDYHQGVVVVLKNTFDHLNTFNINMSRFKMLNIRKIEKFGNHFLIIGRGQEELAIIFDDLMMGDVSFFEKTIFSSVADVCVSSNGDAYFLLKERDSVLKYSMDELLALAK